jgi:hypothetical protein
VAYFRTKFWGIAAAAALATSATGAHALTVLDNYYGGLNTYNGADVIGPTDVFDIKDAVFQRIGAGGNTLKVTIDTNYAGVPGTAAADGTGYGALFLTPGANAWNPTGPAPYADDVYTPGEWAYAFTVPQDPGGASSGSASLYAVSDGSVVMSNVFGDPITYPFPGNPGFYFRQGQAVQFTPNGSASALAGGGWAVNPGKLVFTIDDNHLLGNSFAFAWAMTCGNDVIQGQVAGIPEPTTWALSIVGFAGIGGMLRRQRRLTMAAA